MTTIFYFVAILYFFSYFSKAMNPSKEIEEISKFTDREFFNNTEPKNKAEGCIWMLRKFVLFIWCVIGLAFSQVWIAFALLMSLGIISGLFKRSLGKKREKTMEKILKTLQYSISALILLYIFLSYFHPETTNYINRII